MVFKAYIKACLQLQIKQDWDVIYTLQYCVNFKNKIRRIFKTFYCHQLQELQVHFLRML